MRAYGQKRRQWFNRKATKSEEVSLQITSMADIFTILLVFLLKSYSTSTVHVSPSNGLLLPQAKNGLPAIEALKLEVSATGVQVEGQPVAPLEAYKFDRKDIGNDGVSKSLEQALAKERQRQLVIAKENPDVKPDARIMIIADKKVPYSTLKTVLSSAAVQGYTDFKLVVIREE